MAIGVLVYGALVCLLQIALRRNSKSDLSRDLALTFRSAVTMMTITYSAVVLIKGWSWPL